MPESNQNLRFSDIELLIYRVASIVFLILMLLKFFKHEVSSW